MKPCELFCIIGLFIMFFSAATPLDVYFNVVGDHSAITGTQTIVYNAPATSALSINTTSQGWRTAVVT
jgi:hypothetical protein